MFFKNDIQHRSLFILSLSAFCLAIIVVVLGAFTRLADAGLGCPDWPGCYGHLLWPNESHEIIKAEQAFPDAPVELDKTWPEMVHRYFAGMLGLLILSMTIVAFSNFSKFRHAKISQRPPIKLPIFLLGLVILQAAFGMWTVTLKLWPQIVTAHLLGGFSTLALLWLLAQRLGGEQWLVNSEQYEGLQVVKPILLFSFVVLVFQIALGGWVSSNYAALACPDFPQCLGQWLPPMDVKKGFNISQDIGPNYLGGQLDNHGRTAIHFFHRLGALSVLLTFIFLSLSLWKIRHKQVRAWVITMLLVLGLQIFLGIANVVFALPLAIAVAHNAVGALLLLVLISIMYRVYSMKNLNSSV